MSSPTTLEIVITPALDRRGERLAGRFDARLGRGEWLARADVTPFYRAAQVLLSRGIASHRNGVYEGRAGQGAARHGPAWRGVAGLGSAGQGEARWGAARHGRFQLC
jgi:hypothetical protein